MNMNILNLFQIENILNCVLYSSINYNINSNLFPILYNNNLNQTQLRPEARQKKMQSQSQATVLPTP